MSNRSGTVGGSQSQDDHIPECGEGYTGEVIPLRYLRGRQIRSQCWVPKVPSHPGHNPKGKTTPVSGH